MANLDPHPKEGGELGVVREAFPGVFYAENPTHPQHFAEGRLHESLFVNRAVELGLDPYSGGRAYNKTFLTLRMLALQAGVFPKKGLHDETLSWEETLDITPVKIRQMRFTLISAAGLLRAHEVHKSNREKRVTQPYRFNVAPLYQRVIESLLTEQGLSHADVALFDLDDFDL